MNVPTTTDGTTAAASFRRWLRGDHYRLGLLVGGFLFAGFILQGLPYWDDDYTSFFTPLKNWSLLRLLWRWLSPVYQGSMSLGQVDRWGFQDRTAQFVVYKLSYVIAGYNAWPYLLFKCACFAGLGIMIYAWALRLLPRTPDSRKAAFASAIFFLFAPGPAAAMVWLADFAPAAELAFLVLTFLIWDQIEKTPIEWKSPFPLDSPAKRVWLRNWIFLSLALYLAYKTKADLKIIPAIVGAYLLLLRAKQWRLFAIPVGLMLILAIPWHSGMFTELPPFLPGAARTNVGFYWQPASLNGLRDFLWASGPYRFVESLTSGTLSLSGLLGPFLLLAIAVFLWWRLPVLSKIGRDCFQTSEGRARLFVFLWFGTVLAAASALPFINYFFRIRYGILTLIPVSILLAWVFGSFSQSARSSLPRWATVACLTLFTTQSGINLSRAISYRRDLGGLMNVVDQAYSQVDRAYPDEQLALWPGFLSYNYRSEAGPALQNRDVLASTDDLLKRHTPNHTVVISWQPPLWNQLDLIQKFSGCKSWSLFDKIFPCNHGPNLFLTRYIGNDAEYQAAEAARLQGDLAQAKKLYEAFLVRHPQNLGARLQSALVSAQVKDWSGSERNLAAIEETLPDDSSVLYNRALAMIELGQLSGAIGRLKRVVQTSPDNSDARIALAHAYALDGKQQLASETLQAVKQTPLPAAAPDGIAQAEEQAKRANTPEAYLSLSLEYYRNKKFQESITAAKEALKIRRDFSEAYNNIGAAYNAMAMWDDAIPAEQEALKLKPDFQLAKNNLAWSLSEKKKIEDALAAQEQQAKFAPTAEQYLQLSLAYCQNRKFTECIEASRKALKLKPDYAEAYNNMAAAYEAMSQWDQAIAAAQQAVRLKPDFQLAKNNLAWAQSQMKLQSHSTP